MSKENPVPQTKDRTQQPVVFERNIFEQLPEHFLKSNNSEYKGFESLFAYHFFTHCLNELLSPLINCSGDDEIPITQSVTVKNRFFFSVLANIVCHIKYTKQ